MATPKTRYDAIGTAGRKGGESNTGYSDPAIKTVVEPITIVASTAEQDTGFTFPSRAAVISAKINVRTEETTGTTKTVDVGITGDPDAILDGADVSAATLVGSPLDAGLSGTNLTYALGSADFAELDAEIIVTYLVAEV